MYNLRNRQINSTEINDENSSVSKKRSRHIKLIQSPSNSDDEKEKEEEESSLFDPRSFKKPLNNKLKDDSSEYCVSSEDEENEEEDDESMSCVSSSFSENSTNPDDENENNRLIDVITQKLSQQFPEINSDDLKEAVTKSFDKIADDIVNDCCGTNPKDESWKSNLTPDEIAQLEPELKKYRELINDRTITLDKILKANLSDDDKTKAIQLFDILQNTEPYTLAHLELNEKIGYLIFQTQQVDSSTSSQITDLRRKLKESHPTLEKIIKARLSECNKLKALALFDSWQQTVINSAEWFELQNRINEILKGAAQSDFDFEIQERINQSAKQFNQSDLRLQIFSLSITDELRSLLYEMYNEMISSGSSSRAEELRDKLSWAVRLPYQKRNSISIEKEDLNQVRNYCLQVYRKLNSEVYGMKEVKERVVQIVNDRLYNQNPRSILALKGKPGVGKTKIARTIANAVNRPFDKISFGGAHDPTILKGSNSVWKGAVPSLLLQILARHKCNDPVILLDEIDKLGTQEGEQLQHALLHILDPSQSSDFQDGYLSEFSHDISGIWFILAMNDEQKLHPALRDRLDIIELPSYSPSEMVEIIINHTLPEALADKGIKPNDLTITEDAARLLIKKLAHDVELSGMRPIEAQLYQIVSRLNLLRSVSMSNNDDNALSLSFSVPKFSGFPYVIDEHTIENLVKTNPEKFQAFHSMYY